MMKTCAKGHQYNGDLFSECPQCAKERQNMGNNAWGDTLPPNFGGEYRNGTKVPNREGGFGGTTNPGGGAGFGGISGDNYTRVGNAGMSYDSSDGKTRIVVNGVAGFNPVTGWLVCVDGPSKGTDYRIHSGYNYIGRAECMDICIKGDESISRERHALIAYDTIGKIFYFAPAGGVNMLYLNGKAVLVPTELHPYDELTLGKTKVIFVPLCGQDFTWEE